MPRRILTLTRRDYFADRRARISISRTPRQFPMGQHRHEFFEIAVVLSGGGIHVTGGFRHRLEAGDVLFLDPHRAHGYEEPQGLNLLNILIRDDALARFGRELAHRPGYHALFRLGPAAGGRGAKGFTQRVRLSPRELEQIEEWATRIEEGEKPFGVRTRTRSRLLEEAYLALIVDMLSRKYGQTRGRGATSPTNSRTAPPRLQVRMGRVLSWIEANLAQPIRLADLAARAGMSKRTFHRAFRSATGTSPHAYVAKSRLTRAAERLADPASDESISETAQGCGFADSNYFSRAFLRFSGKTPKAYRAAQRKARR